MDEVVRVVELGQMLETLKLGQHFIPLFLVFCLGQAQTPEVSGGRRAQARVDVRRGLTSGDVQTLHRQHPVVVAGVTEAVLHHGVVGELFGDFHGVVLSPGLVKRSKSEKNVLNTWKHVTGTDSY